MKIGNGFYPYPVLSDFNEDYKGSVFNVEYSVKEKGFNTKIIVIDILLEDKLIDELIWEDKLKIIVHLECSRTSYRKLEVLKKEDRRIEIKIDSKEMIGNLEVNTMIVVNEVINEYGNRNFNKNFYGSNYTIKDLEPGNIIGATVTQVIDLPMNKDNFENIASIINVGCTDEEEMSVDYNDDIIIIRLPKREYERYYRLSNTAYSSIVMTSTILPSLIFILDLMGDENSSADSNLNWYKVIENKLEEKNIYIEDINTKKMSIELAQMILEYPLERALEELDKELERE